MNLELRVLARHLGLLVVTLSALIALTALFAVLDPSTRAAADRFDLKALLLSALAGALLGGALCALGRRPRTAILGRREAMLLVASAWILGAALAAMPFRLWGAMRTDAGRSAHGLDSFVDCYFEAMSGLTTTGSTVIGALDTMPRSLLLWRGLTQWLGGFGIVVLFVVVLPVLGVGGRRVFRMEKTGSPAERSTPRIQDTARVLLLIYGGLSAVEAVLLRACGMSWFDAVCHTFATLATGGFGTRDQSIAAFPVAAVYVVIVFMLLSAVNFGLYVQLIQRNWRDVVRDSELRAYLLLILFATVVVVVSLRASPPANAIKDGAPAGTTHYVRDALFQVVSLNSTTGFCTADFDRWSFPAKAVLVALIFIGASSGSTSGAIKVSRVLLAARIALAEIERIYRPNVVRPVKLGPLPIDPDTRQNVLVFLLGYLLVFAAGTVALMLLERPEQIDITTAATASLTTLSNTGPGLAKVGATQNFAWFSPASKMVMSLLMLLGRLELFTIAALLTPRFWREE